jgi:hypothetical protein
MGGIVHLNPTVGCQISTLIFGLVEVQNPNQALNSVKGHGNTFDLNPKLERTLPSFGNCSWDIYRITPKSKFFHTRVYIKGIVRIFK